jgi:hypothetical protein
MALLANNNNMTLVAFFYNSNQMFKLKNGSYWGKKNLLILQYDHLRIVPTGPDITVHTAACRSRYVQYIEQGLCFERKTLFLIFKYYYFY